MRQIITILAILFGIFSLGMWGQYLLSSEQFKADFFQAVYNTLTLFVLGGEWTAELDLPWQLEVTRFIAPLASVTGVLVYLTQGAWTQAINFFVRLRQEHVVVAGLGRRSWQFVQSCQGQFKLVIVELDPDNQYIERARSLGMNVVIGDILNPPIFERVNLASARHLVAFTGNDGINVELAIKARAYMRLHSQQQLMVHIHVDNTHIAQRLENYPKFFADSAAAQVEFFSIYDLNSRILLRDYPPECFAYYFDQKQVHFAIYNFERQAEHILLEAVQACHYAHERKVRFTVFDEQAKTKGQSFLSNYPAFQSLCEIEFVDLSILEAKALDNIRLELLQSVTEHVICFPDDSSNLDLALLLRSHLLNRRGCNAPIIVHMEQSSGLAQLLESNSGGPEIPDGLYPFGMLDQVLHYENVLADGLDTLARAYHESYLERREGLDVDHRLYSSLEEWIGLPEPERASNRQSADHLATKLRAVGSRLCDSINDSFEFSDEEALLLAKMEHNRWCANKILNGWQYGPDRVESAKLNPDIGSWDDLPHEEQQLQIQEIRRLVQLVAKKLGKGFIREYRIGVTGHRLHKFDPTDHGVQKNILSTLQKIKLENPQRHYVLMSPLAEGADRMVAQMALEQFDMSLQVVLPLPFELYQTDFTSTQSVEDYKIMVGRSETYYELPMRFGSQEELASHIDGTANEYRNKQYALAGAYLAQNTDALIAIYDGKPEAGVGGTGQIVRWREAGKVDEEYVTRSDMFKISVMNPPIIIEHAFHNKGATD